MDLTFYAPIGALHRLRGGPLVWADEGRRRVDDQVRIARTIGKFAVDRGRRELTRRLDAMAEQRRLAAEGPIIETTATIAPEESAATATVPVVAAATAIAAAPAAIPLHVTALPIDDYDSLAASQVVARLAAFGSDELTAIAEYESAHRSRRTILGKIQQLQAR